MELKSDPLVSVIMSVYNTDEHFLKGAIESVLRQTYANIEFIIIDDASDSWCAKALRQFVDKRLKVYRNKQNLGLTKSLNKALELACGDYIARMDSDDMCMEQRIEEQVRYLEKHKDIDVLACVSYIFDGKGSKRFACAYSCFAQERVRVQLSFDNIQFTHPSIMFRGDFLRENALFYDETKKKAQDYNMWVRCIERGKLHSLQKPLFVSRINDGQIGRCAPEEQRKDADSTKIFCMKRLVQNPEERQRDLYTHFRDVKLYGTVEENIQLIRLLVANNQVKKVYRSRVYCEEIFFWWFRKALNGANRKDRKRMLFSPYICWNVSRIIVQQSVRYVVDMIYQGIVKKKWYHEIKSGTWRVWI